MAVYAGGPLEHADVWFELVRRPRARPYGCTESMPSAPPPRPPPHPAALPRPQRRLPRRRYASLLYRRPPAVQYYIISGMTNTEIPRYSRTSGPSKFGRITKPPDDDETVNQCKKKEKFFEFLNTL